MGWVGEREQVAQIKLNPVLPTLARVHPRASIRRTHFVPLFQVRKDDLLRDVQRFLCRGHSAGVRTDRLLQGPGLPFECIQLATSLVP